MANWTDQIDWIGHCVTVEYLSFPIIKSQLGIKRIRPDLSLAQVIEIKD